MPLSIDEQKVCISIWQKAVDTQMHFNEMSVKARQFGLAFVAAALGLAVVLFTRGQEFSLPIPILNFDLHATVVIVLASACALYAVRLLDLGVYHKMLRGAVAFGEDFEENYMKQIFVLEKGMTQAISHFSRYQDATVEKKDGKYAYRGADRKTAEEKIKCFYNFSISALVITAFFLFIVTANFGHAMPKVQGLRANGVAPASSTTNQVP